MRPQPAPTLWMILAVLFFPANIYFLYHLNRTPDALAEFDGQKLALSQISAASAQSLQALDNLRYAGLEREARDWASKIALEKEAKKSNKSVEKFLADETSGRVQVSDAEVMARYTVTPVADFRPYPGVLQEIRASLTGEKYAAVRDALVDQLLLRDGFRVLVPKPASYVKPKTNSIFPPYEFPSGDELSGGRVVGAAVRGPASAPVTIEIYSDFFCPFSRKFSATMKELESKYAGKLKIFYRHFPLPMHVGADRLAQASACAQEQGKFWEMHDRLMAWEGAPEDNKLIDEAQKLGVDPAAFTACLKENRYADWVKRETEAARRKGVNSTPTLFLNGRLISGALPTDQMFKLIDWFLNPVGEYPGKMFNPYLQNRNRMGADAPMPPPVDDKPATFDKAWLELGPSEGKANAPVTIVEFADFNCPFCKKGADSLKSYFDSEKPPVRLISKQFPLAMHPNAQKAGVAALCANEQGKYWAYRSELFGSSWGKQTPEDLKAAAAKLGMDQRKFDACLDADQTLERVKKDMAAGQGAGVRGTPTFFINGQRVVGANIEQIKKLIQDAASPAKR